MPPRDLLCLMSVAPVTPLSCFRLLPTLPAPAQPPQLLRDLAPSSVGPSSAKPLPFSSPDLFLGPGVCSAPRRRDLSATRVSSFRLFSPSTPVSPVPWVKFSVEIPRVVWFLRSGWPPTKITEQTAAHSCDDMGASRDVGALPAGSPTTQSSEGGPTEPPSSRMGPPAQPCTPWSLLSSGKKAPWQLPACEAEALPTTRGGPDTC